MASAWQITAALLIAAAILLSGRYQLIAGPDSGIFRLDRLTGVVHLCLPVKNHPFDLGCIGTEADEWVDVPKK